MNAENNTFQEFQDKLADLKETMERGKIRLPKSLEEKLQIGIQKVQEKLSLKVTIYKNDLQFIDYIREYIKMPEPFTQTPKKIDVSSIWSDILYLADCLGKDRKWIDETFTFFSEGYVRIDEDFSIEKIEGLTHLPENMVFKKDLIVSDCPDLTHFPKSIQASKNIRIKNCKELSKLQDKFIGIGLEIENCPLLESLPKKGVYYEAIVAIKNCKNFKNIPNTLGFKYLSIENCGSIQNLPEKLIANDLILKNLPNLQNIPFAKLEAPFEDKEGFHTIHGSLEIENCPHVSSFPEMLHIKGDMILIANNGIYTLPHTLVVDGSFILHDCSHLEKLGEKLMVKGDASISQIPFTKSPKIMIVNGSYSLENCPNLIDLPGFFKVGEWMSIQGCNNIKGISPKTKVGYEKYNEEDVLRNVYLSPDSDPELIKGSKKLQKAGKIRGKVLLEKPPKWEEQDEFKEELKRKFPDSYK